MMMMMMIIIIIIIITRFRTVIQDRVISTNNYRQHTLTEPNTTN